MGQRLSGWMHRFSNGWVTLSTLVIFLLFIALARPGQVSRGNTRSPDLSVYYTAQDLYRIAEAYGGDGRQEYIRVRFTFDLIFPLVYTAFLATATSWVFSRAFAPGSPWQRANLLPLFGALFDYLENLSTSLVMFRYPTPTPGVDGLAGILTLLKWVLLTGSFVLLFIALGAGIWRRARRGGMP